MSEANMAQFLTEKGWRPNKAIDKQPHLLAFHTINGYWECDVCAKQCMLCRGALNDFELRSFKHCGFEDCVAFLANQNKELHEKIDELEETMWAVQSASVG